MLAEWAGTRRMLHPHLVCKWFDEKYKEGSAERAAKVKEAVKVRGYALKRFSMRKKKMRRVLIKLPLLLAFFKKKMVFS